MKAAPALWMLGLGGCVWLSDKDIPSCVDEEWLLDCDQDGFGDSAEDAHRYVGCSPFASNASGTELCEGESELLYVRNAEDCDDDDVQVNPNAVEVCDGIDNDCSGTLDDGRGAPLSWHPDEDGDGFAPSNSEPVLACEAPDPVGYTALLGDCDDTSAEIHPEAEELCDGLDNNCDGVVDLDAVDVQEWFADRDQDGYLDPDTSLVACEAPSVYTLWDDSVEGDCDDRSADVYPRAPEICLDGVRTDCHGTNYDACVTTVQEARTTFVGTVQSGRMGHKVISAGRFNDDDYDDVAVVALRAGNGGLPLIYLGGPGGALQSGGELTLEDADAFVEDANANGFLGVDIVGRFDANGDGLDDLLMSGDTHAKVWLVLGQTRPEGQLAPALHLNGIFGSPTVAAGTNLLGDGEVVLVVGEQNWDGYRGRVSLVSLQNIALPVVDPLELDAHSQLVLTGEAQSNYAAQSMAVVANAVGDGQPRLLVGAHRIGCNGASGSDGGAYLVNAAQAQSGSLGDAEERICGQSALYAGVSVSSAGDFNGDDLDDLLLSANGTPEFGGAFLILGREDGFPESIEDADLKVFGGSSDDRMWQVVASAGDVDGDGKDDIVLGGLGVSGEQANSGVVALVLGQEFSDGQSIELSSDDVNVRIMGDSEGLRAGSAVAGAGDVNGDGFGDLLVGGCWTAGCGERAWLFLGEPR